MENYHVHFIGELKDDVKMQERFVKRYNKWCNVINEYQEKLNIIFDRNWKGEPIQDYSECKEYNDWMRDMYKDILNRSGLKKDLLLEYYIDDELQLYGAGRYGKRKDKIIYFVFRKG